MQLSLALVRVGTAALCGGLVLPGLAVAADGEDTPLNLSGKAAGGAASDPGVSGGGIARTIVGLAVVIGVIYGLTWVLRQVKASKAAGAEGAGLESLATLPLGTNRSLHLVRAGDEVVLVGAGEHGVTPIRSYSVAEARALGLLADSRPDVIAPAKRNLIETLRDRTVIR